MCYVASNVCVQSNSASWNAVHSDDYVVGINALHIALHHLKCVAYNTQPVSLL